MKKIFIILTILASLTGLLTFASCDKPEVKDGKYAGLGRCLTLKQIKFYGAFWCSHCADQKKLFGDDMRYVTYIECDARGPNANPEACTAAKVDRYPTWVFPGQENTTGFMSAGDLAKKANCEDALANPELYKTDTQQSQQVNPTQQDLTQQS